MLLTARKAGESLVIGEGEGAVVVTVLRMQPNGSVLLGVDAPKSVPIARVTPGVAKAEGGGE